MPVRSVTASPLCFLSFSFFQYSSLYVSNGLISVFIELIMSEKLVSSMLTVFMNYTRMV